MKEPFNENEKKLIKVMGRFRQASFITELVKRYYDNPPMEGNVKIALMIRRINMKCERYKLDWYIEGQGVGRGGKVVWKVKRTV